MPDPSCVAPVISRSRVLVGSIALSLSACDAAPPPPPPDAPRADVVEEALIDGGADSGPTIDRGASDVPARSDARDAAEVADVACGPGLTACMSSGCVDTMNDRDHCGDCGRACAVDRVCSGGACACPTGTMNCGGACADVQRDVNHCGACGNACPPTQTCRDGRCACPASAPTTCGGVCADTASDTTNCGACGTVCPAAPGPAGVVPVCAAGRCGSGCRGGTADCDGDPANGCETDTGSNAAHCGACGRACSPADPCTHGGCPRDEWARALGDGLDDRAVRVAVDAAGNIAVVGQFQSALAVGGVGVRSAGGYDALVASYDARGNLRWLRRIGGAGADGASDVAVDAAGNLYVVGTVNGSADLGDGAPAAGAGGDDLFVVSYTPAGAHRWSRRFGGALDDRAFAVALDTSANLYIAAAVRGAVDFGDARITATGQDGVAVSLTSAGAPRWATALSGAGLQALTGVAVTADGHAVFTGNYDAAATIGSSVLPLVGGVDGAVIQLSAAGAVRWARSIGAAGNDLLSRVAVGAMGDSYVVGRFDSPTLRISTSTLVNAGGPATTDAMVVSVGAGGALQWGLRFGGAGDDGCADVTNAPMGNILLAGWFSGAAHLGTGSITSAGGRDAFVIQMAPLIGGAVRIARQYGGPLDDEGLGVHSVARGTILVGSFGGSAPFGFGTPRIESAGGRDAFVARVLPYP